jgi:hypothetical protein
LADVDTPATVLGEEELGGLERILSSTSDDGERARIVTRLQALLAQVNGAGREHEGGDTLKKIRSATADEIFELIDQGLEG